MYDIIAISKERAEELLSGKGEDPNEFVIERSGNERDQRGRTFPEGIRGAQA